MLLAAKDDIIDFFAIMVTMKAHQNCILLQKTMIICYDVHGVARCAKFVEFICAGGDGLVLNELASR